MTKHRASGILLHPTSLPSKWGIGDFGPSSRDFIDFLSSTNQSVWQMLPIGPTGYGDSPYQSLSAFAGNPMLISPDTLFEEGLLTESDFEHIDFSEDTVDYANVIHWKQKLLSKAYRNHIEAPATKLEHDFKAFSKKHASWLDDYALFAALKEHHDLKPWTQWPKELIKRNEKALKKYSVKLKNLIDEHRFIQFIFFKQWDELHEYAKLKHISIIGDVPIFLAHDSSDVWSHQEWFHLDNDGQPTVVAGVPPDYFSATGQRWGNPIYDWGRLKKEGYSFWIERIKLLSEIFDIIRIDHFRGFAGYWEIPASEETAINGEWKKGPGAELFHYIDNAIDDELNIIAEDLGIITDDVTELIHELDYPGMAVLQFGFESMNGNDETSFLPHNLSKNQVVYTATHDNDTTVGWWSRQSDDIKDFTRRYLSTDAMTIHRDFIRAALSSVCKLAIFPMQDLLGLGSEACMNRPGTTSGNWKWRFTKEMLTETLKEDLLEMTRLYGREPKHI